MRSFDKQFSNPLWDNLRKVRLSPRGGVQAPVKANGEDGIVVGDPQLGQAARRAPRPGVVARLAHLLSRA